MKRLFLMMCMAVFAVVTCLAQKESENFTIIAASLSNQFGIQGGKDGKIYQIIVKNDKSKKEVIDLTAAMLQDLGIVTAEEVQKNLDEVNDEMTEYKVPFKFETGIGIHPSGSEPLIVSGIFRFEFYEGGVKLSIEDFDEKFFVVHKTNIDNFTRTKNMAKYDDYCNEAIKVANATSGYGKLIAKIDKIQEINHVQGRYGFGKTQSIIQDAKNQINAKFAEAQQERLNILGNYRARVDEQNELFKKMVDEGEAKWYTLAEYIEDAKASPSFNKYKKAAETMMTKYEKAAEQERLYRLPDKRWHRDMRYIFDGVFITLAEFLDGSIEGVAEDGVQTWEREGDLVVPTNPKEKSKYVKKGKSFTDYDSYDN